MDLIVFISFDQLVSFVEFLIFDIQSTAQKSHFINTISSRRNILFYLNSRIPLVRSSYELAVHCAREISPKDLSYTPTKNRPECPQLYPQSPLAVARLAQIPLGPALRTNPFPTFTGIFDQLPLSTFIYLLEADNLEDLLRLSVQIGVWISHSSRFSRDVQSAPKQPKAGRLS